MADEISLIDAQQLILAQVEPTALARVELGAAAGRLAAESIRAPMPVPAFARSTMDGFAIAGRDLTAGGEPPTRLRISGEIAAGTTAIPALKRGEAIRIMTGGAVPPGADRVIPVERCQERDGWVEIGWAGRAGSHIRPRGCDYRQGQVMVRGGRTVAADQLPFLAEAGVTALPVRRPPRVAVLCTGSELLEPATSPRPGQIIGGNRFQLDALIRQAGGEPVDLGLVADRLDHTLAALRQHRSDGFDMIVTTGGMGPGKYDLMTATFKRLGVAILYRSLNVRPGRATMFGRIDRTLFFALPGPPPAVRILFHELLRPALLAAQGAHRPLPQAFRARLSEAVTINKRGILNLKGGVIDLRQGTVSVRPAGKGEPLSAIIQVPPHRRHLRPGETVTIHTVEGGAGFRQAW